jgi:hypothetical protein
MVWLLGYHHFPVPPPSFSEAEGNIGSLLQLHRLVVLLMHHALNHNRNDLIACFECDYMVPFYIFMLLMCT